MDRVWSAIVGRITPARPVELDAVIRGDAAPRPRGAMLAPAPAPAPAVPVSAALWRQEDETLSRIGIRITAPLDDPARAALHLASAVIERRVIPIILSRLDHSGFERFGFRVERVPDGAGAAAVEAELRKFWNLAIIVDGGDIGRLG
ncbi:hypothetical protein SAMN05444722_3695 [Rhodovulum sp. ES.010]|uniref:hypothetical protein n=1 Tax=Rhodovulum sp. ES.010 TaxID=1882821 RepID=UPI00092C945C|nr:hypothetical protein [Rhodovulum sp. ES.010]SIO57190.1 hypothetical protein SAMN05444722_3695 [Rhodovulum sp. ES.010]